MKSARRFNRFFFQVAFRPLKNGVGQIFRKADGSVSTDWQGVCFGLLATSLHRLSVGPRRPRLTRYHGTETFDQLFPIIVLNATTKQIRVGMLTSLGMLISDRSSTIERHGRLLCR